MKRKCWHAHAQSNSLLLEVLWKLFCTSEECSLCPQLIYSTSMSFVWDVLVTTLRERALKRWEAVILEICPSAATDCTVTVSQMLVVVQHCGSSSYRQIVTCLCRPSSPSVVSLWRPIFWQVFRYELYVPVSCQSSDHSAAMRQGTDMTEKSQGFQAWKVLLVGMCVLLLILTSGLVFLLVRHKELSEELVRLDAQMQELSQSGGLQAGILSTDHDEAAELKKLHRSRRNQEREPTQSQEEKDMLMLMTYSMVPVRHSNAFIWAVLWDGEFIDCEKMIQVHCQLFTPTGIFLGKKTLIESMWFWLLLLREGTGQESFLSPLTETFPLFFPVGVRNIHEMQRIQASVAAIKQGWVFSIEWFLDKYCWAVGPALTCSPPSTVLTSSESWPLYTYWILWLHIHLWYTSIWQIHMHILQPNEVSQWYR